MGKSGRKQLTPNERADKREIIMDAADTCFNRLGVSRTQLSDIGREAGISAGTIYLYFANRDALVGAWLSERANLDSVENARMRLHLGLGE